MLWLLSAQCTSGAGKLHIKLVNEKGHTYSYTYIVWYTVSEIIWCDTTADWQKETNQGVLLSCKSNFEFMNNINFTGTTILCMHVCQCGWSAEQQKYHYVLYSEHNCVCCDNFTTFGKTITLHTDTFAWDLKLLHIWAHHDTYCCDGKGLWESIYIIQS